MNHFLYNIAIFMLLAGIIMLTSYITKAYNKTAPSCQIKNTTDTNKLTDIYNLRPSNIYGGMFNEPSIWQGYENLKNN